MSDVHSTEIRSYNMSMIKGKDTKPELIVRKFLFSRGFRYRINVRELPGTPDIVLKKYKTCIFVNGCFWHGHSNCRFFKWPKTNGQFWEEKINKNIARDKKNHELLQKDGWKVIVVWECELRNESFQTRVSKLTREITEAR